MQSNYCRKNQTFKVGYDDPWRKSKITQNVISNRTMQGTPGESSTVWKICRRRVVQQKEGLLKQALLFKLMFKSSFLLYVSADGEGVDKHKFQIAEELDLAIFETWSRWSRCSKDICRKLLQKSRRDVPLYRKSWPSVSWFDEDNARS